MSLLSSFASFDRKFAWSFLGFVLAVFFGGLTLYNEFIKNPNPQLSVQILADTSVLDVRENVPELKIMYGDADIKSINQTLSVAIFRIQNTGGAPILNGSYDDKLLPTIHLGDGRFIKVEQLSATSSYLTQFGQPLLLDSVRLQLPRVILEPGEAYIIKALLLRGINSTGPFTASGKVAGSREISLVPLQTTKEVPSFWSTSFSGSIGNQLIRTPVYFFGFIALLYAVFGPASFAQDQYMRFTRKRLVKQFETHHAAALSTSQSKVLSAYVSEGLAPLARIRDLLSNDAKLRAAFEQASKLLMPNQTADPAQLDKEQLMMLEEYPTMALVLARRRTPIRLLLKLDIVTCGRDGAPLIDKDLAVFLGKFIDYVNIKKG